MKLLKYLILPIALILGYLAYSNSQPASNKQLATISQASLINLGQAPSFELENSSSKTFSSKSLKGNVWLFNLFFTTCQGPCPITSAHLKTVYNKHLNDKPFSIVSLSVDPKTDTPQKLKEYAEALGVSAGGTWHFLRANLDKVKELSESFHMDAMEHHGMVHSNRVILVDADGSIRGTYLGTEKADIEKLSKDLSKVLSKS